jgi:hypothetical protein
MSYSLAPASTEVNSDVSEAVKQINEITSSKQQCSECKYNLNNVEGSALHKVVAGRHKKPVNKLSRLQSESLKVAVQNAMDAEQPAENN